MYYYAYVLRCIDKKGNVLFYTGSTENLRKRLEAHKSGTTHTTKRLDSIELVYFEGCLNKTDAIKREIQLKTGFGRGYLKRRIQSYLKETRE